MNAEHVRLTTERLVERRRVRREALRERLKAQRAALASESYSDFSAGRKTLVQHAVDLRAWDRCHPVEGLGR